MFVDAAAALLALRASSHLHREFLLHLLEPKRNVFLVTELRAELRARDGPRDSARVE